MSTPNHGLSIFYWFDPWAKQSGGIEQYIKSFVGHAGESIDIEVIGVTTKPLERPVGRWLNINMGGIPLRFYALFAITDNDQQNAIPLSLRFTLALLRQRPRLKGDINIVHRPEPALVLDRQRPMVFVSHSSVHDIHGSASNFRWKFCPRLYNRIEALAVSKASRVVCVLEGASQSMKERQPKQTWKICNRPTWYDQKTFFTVNNKERDQIRQSVRQHLGLHQGTQLLVTVGRLDEEKNHRSLINTMQKLCQATDDIAWLFIGSGSLEYSLKQQVSGLNLTEKVRFLGTQNPSSVANLLLACDLFVLASFYEGMSIALLEAQACGLPVVVSNVGEARLTCEHQKNSVIVSEVSSNVLAPAIMKALMLFKDFDPQFAADAVAAYAANLQVPSELSEITALLKRQ